MERLEGACTGKLLWIWGAYAFLMILLSNVMSDAGFSRGQIWAAAALIGFALLVWTREL
jgi:hypothetical protein